MTYSPASGIALPMVHALGPWGVVSPAITSSAPVSAAWSANNRAYYLPVIVPTTCVIRRLWWANGATVSASYNLDCGVYADSGGKPGTKIISTDSTAQGTASQVQFVDVTDTTLAPGVYWLALSCSSTSATVFRIGPGVGDALYKFQEESALPLPTTATPVEPSTEHIGLFGFATTASP